MTILCAICNAWNLKRRIADDVGTWDDGKPRYVCECGYQVREDDREFHNSMVCPLTAPKTMDEDECPSCGAMVPLRDFGLHCCDYSDDPRPSDAW